MPMKTRSRTQADEAPPAPHRGQPGRSRGGKQAAAAKKTKKRKAADVLSDPEAEPDEGTTDRSRVNKPVAEYIAPTMAGTWSIKQGFQMCILFDVVNPLRKYKLGTKFNENDDDPFPLYNPRKVAEVTESDHEGTLQPFRPTHYSYVQFPCSKRFIILIYAVSHSPKYRFEAEVTGNSFMMWKKGQLHDISYGKRKKQSGDKKKWNMVTKRVPVQYARLLHQFLLEIDLAKHNKAHEILRRQTYAEKVLDEFALELNRFRGVENDFRSKVLTPILQRQLNGIPDPQGPAICKVFDPKHGIPTIGAVTKLYLGIDPLDPRYINSYRHNLVYIREARWHLAIILGKADGKSEEDFIITLKHHDCIQQKMKTSPRPEGGEFPRWNDVEVAAVVEEELDDWFEAELERVVSTISAFALQPLIFFFIYMKPDSLSIALQMRQEQIGSPALFVSKFNNAYIMAVTHSSRTSNNEPDDDDPDDIVSGNDAAGLIAGPSKRRRTSPEVSSTSEQSSEIEDDSRLLSGPPSGVPSTVGGDEDGEDVGGNEDGEDVGEDEDPDAEAARVDADLVASVGNAAEAGGDE